MTSTYQAKIKSDLREAGFQILGVEAAHKLVLKGGCINMDVARGFLQSSEYSAAQKAVLKTYW